MGKVLVDQGALAMVLNALRRDAEEGRPVRGEMADALMGTACAIQCVGFMQFGGKLIDAPPPNTDATPVFILAPNASLGRIRSDA